jgi:hypothetical protein
MELTKINAAIDKYKLIGYVSWLLITLNVNLLFAIIYPGEPTFYGFRVSGIIIAALTFAVWQYKKWI